MATGWGAAVAASIAAATAAEGSDEEEPISTWSAAVEDSACVSCIGQGGPASRAENDGIGVSSSGTRPAVVAASSSDRAAPASSVQKHRPRRLRQALAHFEVERDTVFDRAEHLRQARARIRKRPASALQQAVVAESQELAVPPPKRAKLSVVPADVAAVVAPASGAWCTEWALQPYVRQARIAAGSQSTAAEEDASGRLIRLLLAHRAGLGMGTVSATTALASASRWQYAPLLKRLANAALHADKDARAQLEQACLVSLGAPDLLFLVDAARYDETPMQLSVDSSKPKPKPAAPGSQAAGGDGVAAAPGSQVALQESDLTIPETARKARGIQKLLQSETTWGFIVRKNGTLLTITGRSATWIQLLERTTGEVLLEAARQRSTLSPASDAFAHKVRLSQTDAHGANTRAEEGWVSERGQSWARLPLYCNVHKLAGVHTKTFQKLLPQTVSGQVHFALAINDGSGMQRLKELLRRTVEERLEILRERPPPEADAFRRHVLRLCLARGPHLVARRLALLCLPNGDWRVRGAIQVVVPKAAVVDRKALVECISASLSAVLLPGKFQCYPQSRWTRMDTALDQFCLLEAVHGLASWLFPAWRAGATIRKAKAARAPRGNAAAPAVQNLAIADGPVGDEEAPADGGQASLHGDGEGEGCLDLSGPVLAGGPVPASSSAAYDAQREENERHRREAQRWLDTDPLGATLVFRQCLEPLRRLMKRYLELGGSTRG